MPNISSTKAKRRRDVYEKAVRSERLFNHRVGVKEGKDPKEEKFPSITAGRSSASDGKPLDSGVIVTVLPTAVDLRPNVGSIRNQGLHKQTTRRCYIFLFIISCGNIGCKKSMLLSHID